MYEISVISEFSAAHNLRNYKGKCENIHGHNWKVEISTASKKLDKQGIAIDFRNLKDALEEVLKELDHRNLNDIPYFRKINPTSENIAKYIYKKIKGVKSVKVWESQTSCATYTE